MKPKHLTLKFIPMFFLLFLIVGCSAIPQKTRKPSQDWSRGFPLGTEVLGTVGMSVNQEDTDIHAVYPFGAVGNNSDVLIKSGGNSANKIDALQNIHFVWPYNPKTGGFGLRYVQLGYVEDGLKIKDDHQIIQVEGQVREPRIVAGNNQYLHLFWTNRKSQSQPWELWYALLNPKGYIEGRAVQLSNGVPVGEYDIAADALTGDIFVVWDETGSGGIYLSHISSENQGTVAPALLVEKGSKPAIQIDSQGEIHLVWFEESGRLIYASVNEAKLKIEKSFLLADIPLGTGPRLYGPALGITEQWGYVLWSVLKQSGPEAGSAKTEYVSFPLHKPEDVSTPFSINILPFEKQPYQPVTGEDLLYTQLVPAALATRSSDFVYDPNVMQGNHNEVAFTLAFNQEYRLDSHVQIAVVFMADGEYKGYNVATKTQQISSDAVLSSDTAGNLHLIWRDGASGEKLYYTTTSPEIKSDLDSFTVQDLRMLILTGGTESLAGILLFPLAFPWLFAGLVLVVIWRIARNDESVEERPSQVILLVTLTLYQISKILVLPTMITYVPFSAWVDIPQAWQLPFRILVPLFIFGISIAIAEYLRSRRQSPPSTLYYYFVVVIADTILTLSIYGVNFLGAY